MKIDRPFVGWILQPVWGRDIRALEAGAAAVLAGEVTLLYFATGAVSAVHSATTVG
ncbi:hypothetical protein JYU34_001162 [Plutella xylostella]|uniref:Uncharacterized protein n=1 Tax=Plutella xylostella TaxID=51655 RepID=A0ABQ7R693_PLUXY|nr:hypothetical protein JYU34_005226 [Plutella xylostella]KAG7312781.1 hypothetical protein JYU34_001162 [Plutella xylostella]